MLTSKDTDFFLISWKITNKCNLRCPYCVTGRGQNTESDIEVADWHKTLSFMKFAVGARKAEHTEIYLTGGEPTVVPWLLDFIKACPKKMFNSYRITSNGMQPLSYYKKLIGLIEQKDGAKLRLRLSWHEQMPFEKFKRLVLDTDAEFANFTVTNENEAEILKLAAELPPKKVHLMPARQPGGGRLGSENVKCAGNPTFFMSEPQYCSAGYTYIRIVGDEVRPCQHVSGIIDYTFTNPYPTYCTRKTCPGCYTVRLKNPVGQGWTRDEDKKYRV